MHVYLRRALLSTQWFGDDDEQLRELSARTPGGDRWTFVTRPRKRSSAPASGRGSPTTTTCLHTSSTDDEYWARQAEWHTALYDAGFFGLSWPARFGGHDLPTVFDVILDEELADAGAPPRPSLGYLVQGISTSRQRRDHGPVPARSDQRPRALVPGIQRTRRRLRPRRTAHDRDARRRRVRDRRAQDLDELLRCRRLVPAARAHRSRRAEAQGPFRVRGTHAPAAHRATAAANDQRRHQRVRPGAVRRRARSRREHDRRARRWLAARDDDRESRARTR